MAKKDLLDPAKAVAAFLATIHTDDDIYLGIDPGATGALALLCGRRCFATDIPVVVLKTTRTKKTTKKEFDTTGHKTKSVEGSSTKADLAGICEVFRALRQYKPRITVALEEVPSSLGPGRRHAEIMLNRAYAMWPLFLYSKGYAVEELKPTIWKQKMGLRGKEKEFGRQKALAMFPGADILRKKDHDRAEALLLAEYLRRLKRGEE